MGAQYDGRNRLLFCNKLTHDLASLEVYALAPRWALKLNINECSKNVLVVILRS